MLHEYWCFMKIFAAYQTNSTVHHQQVVLLYSVYDTKVWPHCIRMEFVKAGKFQAETKRKQMTRRTEVTSMQKCSQWIAIGASAS